MLIDAKAKELIGLMNSIIELAIGDPNAPIREMPAIGIITSSLEMTLQDDGQIEDAQTIMGALAGTLAWIVCHNWKEVSAAIRETEGQKIH
jgi:hypothetical protein